MDLGLASRRAFVAASSAGLGRASADALLGEGAEVVLNGRDADKLERTRAELAQKHGRAVRAWCGDLSHPTEAARAAEEAAALLGGLDVLVVNGGGPPAGTFATHDAAAWRSAADALLLSTVEMIRAALPHLERSEQPRIVLIASTAVKQPIANLILSNSVRAAVVGLAKTLSQELGPRGILVNVLCPGTIDTDRIRHLGMKDAGHIPLGRFGRPDEFGAVVAFLASARASYLTGVTVQVDGGSVRSLL
jgi:3-oxoacyl-[acyl-carrier protein] reductase